MIAGPVVPSEIRAALARYVEHHIETGGFLRAVLENDLVGAVTRADHLNFARLPEIIRYIYETLPVASYGTPAKVLAWLAMRRDPLPPDPNRVSGRERFPLPPDTTLLGPNV